MTHKLLKKISFGFCWGIIPSLIALFHFISLFGNEPIDGPMTPLFVGYACVFMLCALSAATFRIISDNMARRERNRAFRQELERLTGRPHHWLRE